MASSPGRQPLTANQVRLPEPEEAKAYELRREIDEWNAAVDARKRAKRIEKLKRLARAQL